VVVKAQVRFHVVLFSYDEIGQRYILDSSIDKNNEINCSFIERDREFCFKAEVPGASKEDIKFDINFDDGSFFL